MISICFTLLFALLTSANINNASSTIRIYSNLAEIIQPIGQLPLEFTDDDWNNIRSDSITLIGQNVNITSQTITKKKKILNGTDIYIRSPVSSDKTTITLIKGILVDEINHLVKIQDKSIADQQTLYFTVQPEQIFYLEEPVKPKYYVNFTYITSDKEVFVSYLRSDLNWQTQYQLNLYNDESDLIAMANIRNDGKLSVSVDQAELIGGDINLQTQEQQQQDRLYRRSRLSNDLFRSNGGGAGNANGQMSAMDSNKPTVEQGEELAGLYVYSITKPFMIDAETNYLLPMFRPRITIERYNTISKSFSTMSNTGKAQRSYRLRSDRYLSRGSCIIRELDRIVGETVLPNLAAKDKYEFSIGEDADVIYKENVTLISSTAFNETKAMVQTSTDKVISPVIITRTRYFYEIHVQVKNFKNRLIKVEYEQKGFYSYISLKLTMTNEYQFIQDGSSIKSNMTLKANTDETYSYIVELVN